MKKSLLALGLLSALPAYAEDLNLWQVAYKAETSYGDGYTITGNAYEGFGSFEKEGDKIVSIRGEVNPSSMDSGLSTRDRSIRELVFETSDGSIPNIVFESNDLSCQMIEGSEYCLAKGTLTVKGETQPIDLHLWISDYEGKTWIHSDAAVNLSDYNFHQNGPSAIKVADLIELNIDFLAQ